MNSHHLNTITFLELLMENKIFQGWYRLSVLDEQMMKWFHSLVTVDNLEFNTACQNILRTFFTLLENSFHSLNLGFEKAYLDYMMSDEFTELYEKTLPLEIRGNRAGAIYLIDTLKTIFEDWYYDAFTNLIVPDCEEDSESDDYLDHESYTVMTQLMVGGAIPKLKLKFGCNDAVKIIDSMGFRQFSGEVGQEYINEYVPPVLQHLDRGGLTLIKPAFFPFARDLINFCVDANSEKSIYKNRNDWIKDGLAKVWVDKTLLSKFREVVITLHGPSMSEKLISGIYKRMASYATLAYSKYTNKKKFNAEKSSATDTSNVKFRTLVQTGSSPSGDKSKDKKKRRAKKRSLLKIMLAVNAKHAMSEQADNINSSNALTNPSTNGNSQGNLPISAPNNNQTNLSQPRKKPRRTDSDFKSFYHDTHQDALAKLDTCTKSLSRLSLKFCCSILFVSFGIFHRDTKISAVDAKKELNRAIHSNPNWRQPISHSTDQGSTPMECN